MPRTLLELMQAACDEIGIPQPSSIIGSVDDQSRQLLALANREGKDFSVMANSRGGWQALHKEYVFQTEVPAATTGDTTAGSKVITNIPSTAGITAEYWFVTGDGLPYQAKVVSVDSGTQVTLDRPVSETATGAALQFSQGAYAMPADFEYFVQKTFWDGTMRWELMGPISAQEKNVLRYGVAVSGPRRRFYIRDNRMFLDPVPATDNESIAFDYFSNYWCQSSGGTDQARWTADTDTYLLDEDCFIQGIKWRFLRSKGMDYGQEKMDYDADCMRVLARDGGNRALPLGNRQTLQLLSNGNIPDTGFGQ